ncbi:MAG: hypothetical protein ABGZ37_00115, partial [Akkermansiaceae bacterium]
MFDSYQNPYVVAEAPADVRATFIRKTYAHLAGAIAAFVAAAGRYLDAQTGEPPGSISLLITGDEEGQATNGTTKVLDWMAST